jgi:hypothetical protein
MATGWNFHELYLWHDTGNAATFFPPGLTIEPGDHAENSATKRRFRNLVNFSGYPGQLVQPHQEAAIAAAAEALSALRR